MKQRIFTLNLMLLLSMMLFAQELEIKSFKKLKDDSYARKHERVDLNNNPCGVVKVSLDNAKDYTFTGNYVVSVVYNENDAIVYMAQYSTQIVINSQNGSLKYTFPETIKKHEVYSLKVKSNIKKKKEKYPSLIMPLAGLGGNFNSFGLMLGKVKKWGYYGKITLNADVFEWDESDMECLDDGSLVNSNYTTWYTGKTTKPRASYTVGVLRSFSPSLFAYAGVGSGYHILGWEDVNGYWVKNQNHSYIGFEAEIGLIYRLEGLLLSAGYQTSGFKHHEATVGIGFMFGYKKLTK